MAMPSSKQSTTTADTTDTSECHTLCPYLHIKQQGHGESVSKGCRLSSLRVLHMCLLEDDPLLLLLPCCCCAEEDARTHAA